MKSLIAFEMKKFIHRKKNFYVILLFVILSIIFISLNLNLEKNVAQSEKTSIEFNIESVKDGLASVKSDLKKYPNNQNLKNMQNDYERDLDLLEKMSTSFSKNDVQSYLKYKIESDENLVSDIENNKVISGVGINDIKQAIKINTILLENNITPINTNLSMEGFNFIRLFLNNPISIILAILIIILSADSVSSEFDSNTYKLLFTQPISKVKILISKIIATLIMVYSIILGILTILFLVLGLKNGFGNINYPIAFYNGQSATIEIGNLIIYNLILLVVLIAFISILAITISSFTKNNSSSLATSIIIVVSAYMFSKNGFGNSIAHLNPFVYLDISSVVQGTSSILYDNNYINLQFGILTLGISISLLIALITIYFQRGIKNFIKKR